MAQLVYLLCAITSLACAVLLLRGYRRTAVRLLLWSGLCFTGLALDNMILIFDRIILPDRDLSFARNVPGLLALMLLLFGLVWDSK
jgi:hypothetical protein